MKLCHKCKKREVERIKEWESLYCSRCNDSLIEQTNKRREWDYFHPGESMPESER